MSAAELTDEQIIAQIKQTGDRSGFSILYQRYAHLLFGWCMRYLKQASASEDAVMDVMQQLLENIDKYEIKDFKNWLFLVTRNHCFMRLRSKTEVLVEDINELDRNEFVENAEEKHLNHERRENALHEAVHALKDEQRVCIVLFYFHKKSYREIEEMTGYDAKKVKSHIQNGKRNLRISLEGVFDEE